VIAYPSKVLVIADYENYHFIEKFKPPIDFVLSCGDVPFHVLEEIYEFYKKPIFAVKGNHDPAKPFPSFVEDVHFKIIVHRNYLIGGWQGVPYYKNSGHYQWDDAEADFYLSKFPYVDIFICHAPVYKMTDKEDYAHTGSEAILKYIKEKQPKYVYHGHVHSKVGTMIGRTAIVSIFGAQIVNLT